MFRLSEGSDTAALLAQDNVLRLLLFPFAVALVGMVASIIGSFFVKTNDEAHLHGALFKGLIVASVVRALAIVATVIPT